MRILQRDDDKIFGAASKRKLISVGYDTKRSIKKQKQGTYSAVCDRGTQRNYAYIYKRPMRLIKMKDIINKNWINGDKGIALRK